MFFLKLTLGLLLPIIPLTLAATLISSHHYTVNTSPFSPQVGAYLKNYAGRVIKNLKGEDESVISLPVLKVEDHIWEGRSLTLECWSNDHPVYWEYKGLGAPKVRVTTLRTATDFYDHSTYKYGAIVTFSSTNYRQTGEFTCRPVDSPGGVPLYVFVPGKRLFVAWDEDKNGSLGVSAEDDNAWVTLPCAPSVQDATVQLFNEEQQKLELGPAIQYDPVEGFKIKWKGLGALKSPWGNYLCVGSGGKITEEKLQVKLTAPNSAINKFSSSATTPPTQVYIDYDASLKSIFCCNTQETPNLGLRNRFKRQKPLPPRMKLSSCSSIADCFFTSTLLTADSSHCPTCDSDSFIKKVNESCVAYELPEVQESFVLDCSVAGESDKKGGRDHLQQQTQFSYDPILGLFTNFDTEVAETAKIVRMGRETSPGKAEASYYCSPNPFFFSTGIKWALQGSDGKLKFLNDEDSRASIKLDEKMRPEVSKVFCFAPIWDSANEWRNISMLVPRP